MIKKTQLKCDVNNKYYLKIIILLRTNFTHNIEFHNNLNSTTQTQSENIVIRLSMNTVLLMVKTNDGFSLIPDTTGRTHDKEKKIKNRIRCLVRPI